MSKYNAAEFFMIRTPIISVNDYLHMFDESTEVATRLKEAFNTNVLREALSVASNDLLDAEARTDLGGSSKSSRQLLSSLIKYFIRISTRPTPFGLFSGISLGCFGDASDIVISDIDMHSKRARVDMEWI